MPDQPDVNIRKLSRRHTFRLGLGTAAIVATGGASRSSYAQSTPGATPIEESDYAQPEMLVDAAWLDEHRNDSSLVLVGFMPADDFAHGHIPGSVQVDWPELEVIETSDESIGRWREETSEILASLAITRDSTVVAYDAGTLFAARLWWILHYLGHEQVHVLNGGLAAWQQAAGDVSTDTTPTADAESPEANAYETPQAEVLAQLDEVRASLDNQDVAIIDARTPGEYADGHIPGAVNINYPRNALAETPMFWKPANELRAMYEEAGITPDKRVIPYCSTGVRSAVTFFTLRLIGYKDIGLYTGSWKEWGGHPDTPKAVGN